MNENTGFVHAVDKGFSPLDEELELLSVELIPSGHESLVRLSGWVPFRRARKIRKRRQERAYLKHLENWQLLDLSMPVIQKKVPAQSKPNPWRNFKLNSALYHRSDSQKL